LAAISAVYRESIKLIFSPLKRVFYRTNDYFFTCIKFLEKAPLLGSMAVRALGKFWVMMSGKDKLFQ